MSSTVDTGEVLIRNDYWAFYALSTASDTDYYVPSSFLTNLKNIGPLMIQGASYSMFSTNAISVEPAIWQVFTPNSLIGQRLDSFAVGALGTTTRAYFPLNIPLRLDDTTEPFQAGCGAPGAAAQLEITAWGVFDKSPLQEPPPVRFASPQTVQVEGVHLWPRR